MLISKIQFLHFANRYKHCVEEQHKFHDAIRPYFDFPVCNYLQQAINGLEELLTVVCECEDEDGVFGWWAENHPNEPKAITVRDTKTGVETIYDVEAPEGLYNYLYDMYHKENSYGNIEE